MIDVLFHSSCPDGFAAAWLAWHYYGHHGRPVALHPGVYDKPTPVFAGRDVLIVDFSLPPHELVDLCARARTVTWLDHHASAIDDWNRWLDNGGHHPANLELDLDLDRSGAMLAWDWFRRPGRGPGGVRWSPVFRGRHPVGAGELGEIIERIDTRDRWVKVDGDWALDGTEEVLCALTSRPYTIEAWDEAIALGFDGLVDEGASIVRYRRQLVAAAVEFAYEVTIAGNRVHCANVPYAIGSDVCEALNRRYPDEPFSAYWFTDGATQKWGLRSNPDGADGADVAAIARLFGGGGHIHASGFRVPDGALGDALNPAGRRPGPVVKILAVQAPGFHRLRRDGATWKRWVAWVKAQPHPFPNVTSITLLDDTRRNVELRCVATREQDAKTVTCELAEPVPDWALPFFDEI